MPLTKQKSTSPVADIKVQNGGAQEGQNAGTQVPPLQSVPTQMDIEKAAKTLRGSAPLSKEGYWDRKEARDIRTGECIRLSGILQALLGSVNYGQYCTTADKDAYLAQVKQDAKALAKFVTEEA